MSVPQYRKTAALALVAGLGLSLTACSTKSDDATSDAGGKVTITVDCQPVGSQKDLLQNWNDDVAEFQRQNPNIVVKSVSVGEQCNNPPDFTARLAGGTVTDLFYGYMTDLQQVLDSGQAMDITEFANKETIPTWDSVDPALKEVFTEDGKLYAVPTKNYSMGLLYNKTLFQQAGLDPNNPPKTWPEVREAAKKISALGNGIAGYAEYSAGNTGGWHFTALLYSQGGQVLTEDGKKADFNNAMGRQVLQNLKDMRYGDNSMGSRQLLQWADLLTNAAAGKVGMFIGAPDATTAIVTQFQGKYQDWAMAPMPGQDGPARNPRRWRGLLLQEGPVQGAGRGRSEVAGVREVDARQGPVRLRPGQAAEPAGRSPAADAVLRGQRRAEAGGGAPQGERQPAGGELHRLRGDARADQG